MPLDYSGGRNGQNISVCLHRVSRALIKLQDTFTLPHHSFLRIPLETKGPITRLQHQGCAILNMLTVRLQYGAPVPKGNQ